MKTFDEIVKQLQDEASNFLMHSHIEVNGLQIFPKEIEVYYYKKDEFEDKYVHCNELQQNRHNQFYMHRWGKSKDDRLKPGNRASVDFCVSQEKDVYYAYLLRSAVIDGEFVFGPNKVYSSLVGKICDIENVICSVVENGDQDEVDVLFSERVNLREKPNETITEAVINTFRSLELRFVVCDDNFRKAKYRYKERMVENFLTKNAFAEADKIVYFRQNLGYVSKNIK